MSFILLRLTWSVGSCKVCSNIAPLLCAYILLLQIFAPSPAAEYLFATKGPTQCMHTPNVDKLARDREASYSVCVSILVELPATCERLTELMSLYTVVHWFGYIINCKSDELQRIHLGTMRQT